MKVIPLSVGVRVVRENHKGFEYGFHIIATDYKALVAIREWCADQFGESHDVWFEHAGIIWFAEQNDAIAFKIRWV